MSEGLDQATALIQEAKGLADGPDGGSVTDHLDFAESWISKADDHIASLTAENERLREIVQWFVDNDETNEGDTPLPEHGGRTWDELNAFWIAGLNRARATLETKP